MAYQPIENYGIIGDMHTCALVGMDGSIDWFCFPHFDSPSVFGALLDRKKGGNFQIAPAHLKGVTCKQLYWPDTNVLITRFLSPEGVGETIDYMPVSPGNQKKPRRQLVRRVNVVRGELKFRMECRPAFNYARDPHKVELSERGAVFRSEKLTLALATRQKLEAADGGAVSEFTLTEGQKATFVLQEPSDPDGFDVALNDAAAAKLFRRTVLYWRQWIGKSTYTGRWREVVNRSALVLKLLTYQPTGAIVAAPTCSIPEAIGGGRNWDYRYTWIRDASFTLYGLLRIGFTEAAEGFMHFLEARLAELEPDGPLQIMYGIDGRHDLAEETLLHLEGYRRSKPVRIGNDAYKQVQLDIYGAMMDAVYLYDKYGTPISYDLWKLLRRLVNWVCDHWRDEDEGIWEVRGGRRQFVYSKLMCWVALDRALRLARKRSFPAENERWLKTRDEIYEDIQAHGWNPKRQAYVQAYGSDTLDAANLIMPLVFFLSPNDPRMLRTLEATMKPPHKGGLLSNSLVYRYNLHESPDGLDGEEGAFNMCTFWLVEALTRAARNDREKLHEARLIFDRMLGYANHLGLFAEETGRSGEALGNFPQAFTHLGLISAAFNLDRALGKEE